LLWQPGLSFTLAQDLHTIVGVDCGHHAQRAIEQPVTVSVLRDNHRITYCRCCLWASHRAYRVRRGPCVKVGGRVVLTTVTSYGLMATTVQANNPLGGGKSQWIL